MGRRWAAVVATVVTCLLPAAFAGAATPEVRSGPLIAAVGEDPWSLALVDRDGRTVLQEDAGTGSGPTGTLGFRTARGWSHATRATDVRRSGNGLIVTLDTTDPLRTIEAELSPDGRGVIGLDARLIGPAADVEAMGIAFESGAAERYLGFGERSNQVDQAGGTVENYVADGPYQDEEYAGISLFVPPWGLRDRRRDATYFPIPWLLSSEGYGALVDNPETSTFRLRTDSEDAWSVEVTPAPAGEAGAELAPPVTRLAMRFFAGPSPADALRRFSSAVGRQPRAAAPWTYGPWFQPGDDAADLEALRDADAPVSVFQTYTHYLPCGEQDTAAERARTDAAHEGGVAITTYFNPMVCANYEDAYGPAVEEGALTRTSAGTPYLYRYGANPDDLFLVGQYDFFEPEARELYAGRLGEAVADGYDGWMEDFGEYTPLDSVSGSDVVGTRAHNEYARRYHCAAFDAVRDSERPVVRFQRSGWTGAARCAQVVWGGDPTTGWGFDGLRSAVTQALSAGTSGIGIWGSDIGGFFALGANQLSPELLMRWVQLGAVSGVMRTQRNGVALPPRDRPQVTDPDQIENWRRYAKLRTQLYPYLRAAEREYRQSGLPLMRHLLLEYPRDQTAAGIEDEFMFGPDILAAPVLEEGATVRDVYLPRGRWIDFWRSASFREAAGRIELGPASVARGPDGVVLPAPLDELPLMIRAGAVIPMLPPGVDTLAPEAGPDDELTSLADVRRRLDLLAFPARRHAGSLGGRGRYESQVERGAWRLRVATPRRTRYRVQAALSVANRMAVPCGVEVNGERLPGSRWRYDRKSSVLTARFDARRAVLRTTSDACR